MPTTQTTHTMNLLDKTAAYWYACGYNDHRDQLTHDWVDPMEFASYWLRLIQNPSRPSMQAAFQAFTAPTIDEVTLP